MTPVVGADLSKRLVPDELWELAAPSLPSFAARPQGGGTAPCDERAVFTAVVYALTSACAWRHLPPTFGTSPATAHRRFTVGPRRPTRPLIGRRPPYRSLGHRPPTSGVAKGIGPAHRLGGRARARNGVGLFRCLGPATALPIREPRQVRVVRTHRRCQRLRPGRVLGSG